MFLLACDERLEVTASETLEEITICVGMLDRARVVSGTTSALPSQS
jgi:hypothetical protein